jgi:hypothetical protein
MVTLAWWTNTVVRFAVSAAARVAGEGSHVSLELPLIAKA